MKLDTDTVIKRFKAVHGDIYDYSLINYKNDTTKMPIICLLHGLFYQSHQGHYRQEHGCPKCGKIRSIQKQIYDLQSLINKLPCDMSNVLDFNQTIYRGMHAPIKVRCRKHDTIYDTLPNEIFYKHNIFCPKCNKERSEERRRKNFVKLIEKAHNIHHHKYTYNTNKTATDHYEKINIECPYHGWFAQTLNDHIYGKCGCPICNSSHGETRIGIYLNERNISFEFQHKTKIDNSYHWFDFFIPAYNLMISYHGKQHYMPIKFFGGLRAFKNTKERDKKKEIAKNG